MNAAGIVLAVSCRRQIGAENPLFPMPSPHH
jgi:hypothetical protein